MSMKDAMLKVARAFSDAREAPAPAREDLRQTAFAVSNAASGKTYASSDAAGMAEIFGTNRAASGQAVTETTAMQVATVYRCVALIAGSISQLPIKEYLLQPDGVREEVTGSPLWWLLNERPHARWSASAWKEFFIRLVLLRGDAYAQILRNGRGEPIGFRPFVSGQCQCVLGDDDRLKYHINYYGNIYGLDQDDVLHFTNFGFNGISAPSTIQSAAKQSIGNALAANEYAGKTFSEGLVPQIALLYPDKLGIDQARLLRTSFADTYGAAGGRKLPLVLSEGGNVKELSMTPEDAQLLATRQFEKKDICTAFGVPPIMVGDTEKTTSWGTGIEQITIGYVRYALKPSLVRWEEELNAKLFRRAGRAVEFSLDALLLGDTKAQSDFYRAALGGPGSGDAWMTVDEVRREKNLKPMGSNELFKTAPPSAPAPTTQGTKK